MEAEVSPSDGQRTVDRGPETPFDGLIDCARPDCDVRFLPRNRNHRFCSRDCLDQVDRAGRFQPKTCALDGCDEEFVPESPRQAYHSAECRKKAKHATKVASRARKKTAQREERQEMSDQNTAAAGGQEPTEDGSPTALRQRYLEILLMLARNEPDERPDVFDRLDRIAQRSPTSNGWTGAYAQILLDRHAGGDDQALDRLSALTVAHPTPDVLDLVETLL